MDCGMSGYPGMRQSGNDREEAMDNIREATLTACLNDG